MILVTGGAGFIGSAMVWKLNQVGYTDIIIADSLGTSEKWKNLVGLRFADYLDKDDCLHKLLAEKFPRLDAIIHMGAISTTTEKNLDVLLRSNYEYTKELAAFAVQRSIRFIYASSAATYGDGSQGYDDDESKLHTLRPLNGYGYSKHLFDLWAQRKNLLSKIVGLKFFNVFGPNEYHKDDMASVVFKAYNQILQHGYVKLFKSHHPNYADGEQMRDFVYVKDCVEVMFWLLQNAHVNGILNLGTGKARTFKDLVTATFNAMGKPVQIEYIPMPEVLRDKYQYFTQAQMRKLYAAGCPVRFKSLEESVSDYVKQHLEKSIPYLRAAD
ncbi:MAG: ADP-glyceromanno-heptose 6-epimerase [Candidatus Thermochlorobacter aerophilum]|jgi:ADP-L-glycero-D-manno-heptose 6-epimerase|uniref:ADP-L-glycero-D-manno-heptose-6-epimerase n=1 Tax=Candidatus Thermochlorobacter aerophilus TaxID=1868324 RepID=A0A395M1P7_9BACT|nr:MAG: ADP-glyceromanno-heptose 6-epimerase [Candidatus Thermochlorobacter aerophilum]